MKNMGIALLVVAGVILLGIIAKFPYEIWLIIDLGVIIICAIVGVRLLEQSVPKLETGEVFANIKKIIAREGLIILGLAIMFGVWLGAWYLIYITLGSPNMLLDASVTLVNILGWIYFVGAIIILVAYPVYLLFRFIIWSIRTLREK